MEHIQVSAIIPAAAEVLFAAWLNTKEHSAFTGSPAKCSAKKGGSFSAWDGYISGKNVDLVPSTKIVQAWRTSDFSDADEDSIVHVLLEAQGANKTKLTFIHSNIPAGQGASYKQGWKDFYFTPMKAYYKSKK